MRVLEATCAALVRLTVVALTGVAFACGAARAGGFIENVGQLDPQVRYVVSGPSAALYLTDDGVVLNTKGSVVRTRIVGESSHAWFESRDPRPERCHFFLGSEPSAWRANVEAYSEIVQHDLWPGIDLVYRAEDDRIEVTLAVAPGADPSVIRFAREGADPAHPGLLPSLSGVAIDLASGESAERNDPSRLTVSTFLGGSSDEIGWSSAVDSDGNVFVVGLTISSQFPSTVGAYDPSYNGFGDVFVSKFSPAGNLLWSSFLGGTSTNFDYGYAVAIDANGQPIVTGYTFSADFPTTQGAYDRAHHPAADAFVAKLSANGSQLLWSTFLGGDSNDIGYSVALDSAGRPVVGGRTLSNDFPLTNGVAQPYPAGEEDGFLAKLSSDGSTLAWSTYFGGELYDGIEEVALDVEDHPVVLGFTASNFFPTTPGVQDESWNGGLYDAFVAQFTADGHALGWSRYLGGSEADYGTALALDASGNVFVAGQTESADFPVSAGAYDESWNGGGADAFVAKLAGANGDLDWGTFLGGSIGYYEIAFGVGVLDDGSVVVAGSTPSADFPVTANAFDTSQNGGSDVFLARVSAGGNDLVWSSLLGGGLDDYAYDLVLASNQEAWITGSTASSGFPTTFGAYDRVYNGGDSDVYLSRLRFATAAAGVIRRRIDRRALGARGQTNPIVGGNASLRFTLAAPSNVTAELCTLSGRRLSRVDLGVQPAGPQLLRLQSIAGFDRLGSGVYFVRLLAQGRASSCRLQVVR
ncbi:MAG: SBBP repeat-containing protein [Candidatus Eisenbacteria bacterium]